MAWTTPAATDLRFGFEITMYIANRYSGYPVQQPRLQKNRPAGRFFFALFAACEESVLRSRLVRVGRVRRRGPVLPWSHGIKKRGDL